MTERLPTITPDNRGNDARPNYYARYRYRDADQREPTGARTLKEFAVAKRKIEDLIRGGRWTPWRERKQGDDADNFATFAERVLNKRIAMGVRSAKKDEGGIIRNWLIPEFGSERLSGLVHRRNAEGFRRIWDKGRAPRTVHNIYFVFETVLDWAVREELITVKPPSLSVRHGELPPLQDARPEGWREQALFSLDEIAKLLAAEQIEPQYRTMYSVYFLTGSRFSEITSVRVRDYNRNRKPLGQLTIRSGKVGRAKGVRYRTPPVHPALAQWLDWWLREGFEFTHLRVPQDGDLLFPTLSPRRQKAGQEACSHGEVYKRWARHHLPACGLRHRRLHDARRTLLSLIRSSEAPAEIARSITHTVIADKVLDAYTTFEWQAICKAVLSVDWKLPAPPGLTTIQPEVIDLASRRG